MKKDLLNGRSLAHFVKRYLFFAVLFFTISVWGQTNPTAQILPYTQNFGTAMFTAMPTGTAAWSGLSGSTVTTQALAESSSPNANASLSQASVANSTGGSYGYNATSTSDACYYIQTSGNASNGVNQLATAINTGTGVTSVSVSYDIRVISPQAGIMGIVLQYRAGTSGSWTTVAGSAVTYNNGTNNGGDADTTGDSDSYSFTVSGLTASTAYQFRWATWKGTGTGTGLGIDNIAVISTAASLNGTIDTNEYGTGNSQNYVSGSQTWYMKSDANYLYVGITGATTTEGAVLYLDKDSAVPVNTGNGIKTGNSYDGTNFNELPFNADLVVYFKNGYKEYRTVSGAAWGAAVTTGMLDGYNGTTREIAIPWSAIGGQPSKYNWLGYITSASGFSYGQVPNNNTGGNIGTSANWSYYLTATSATAPMTNTSYTFTGNTDANSFGPISVYDFTMNSSGRNISRSGGANGAWNIGNDLVLSSGSINLGTGANATNIAANLNILGGNLNMGSVTSPITVTKNVSLASGAQLTLSSANGGDLNIAQNFSNAGTFTANSRSVVFNGTLAQSITGVTTFAYLDFNNSTTTSVFSINDNITVGNKLKLSNGKITIATGKTVTIADGANIEATSGDFSAVNTGTINFAGAGSTSGTINFYPAVVQSPGASPSGVSYSTLSTIQNTLTLNFNSFVNNAPKYATGSTLVYNAGVNYNRGIEWGSVGTTFPANGYPHNVTIQNGTTLNIETGLTGTLRANGNLNLGIAASAGSLNMQNTGNALEIKGNVNLGNTTGTSTLTLSTSVGGDLSLAGNWVRNTTNGVLVNNSRAVTFNGTSAQALTGATTFDYLTINNSAGLTLNNAVSVNQALNLTAGKVTIGNNDLMIASTGSISGGSSASYVVTLGTGQLKRTVGSGAAIFPVGSATSYNPITFTNTGTSDVFGVILTAGTVPNVNDAASTVNDRWLVSEGTAGGSNLTVIPQWNTSDQGTNFASGTQAYAGFYNGTSWTQNTATVSGSNPYTATGAASFSPTTLTGTQYFAVGKDNAFICGTTPITYFQGFNSATIPTCWSTTIIPTSTQTGTKISFVTSSTNPSPGLQEGTHFVRYNSYSSGNGGAGSEERLGSNPLSSIGIGSVDVEFYMYNDNGYSDKLAEGIQVQYSLDGTNWTDVSGAYFQRYATSNAWNLKKITLPAACANATKFFVGFKFHSEYGNNIYLDNIVVKQSPPTLFVDGASTKTLVFGTNDIGSTVATQSFVLTGANLTGFPSNITISTPSNDFQVSSDNGTTWSTSATVAYTSATLASTNIFVKYIPTACGITSSGNLTFSGGGVSNYPTVAVSGTANLAKPTNLSATDITATTFTANWTPVSGATGGYELDVYQRTSTPKTFFENFETGLPTSYTTGNANLSTGTWTGTRFIKGTTQPNSGTSVLQLESFTDSNLITPSLENISSISFWLAGSNSAVSVKVQYSYDGTNWFPVDPNTPTYYKTNGLASKELITPVIANPILGAAKIRFLRFGSTVYIDDVTINYTQDTYTYVSGYNPNAIPGVLTNSQVVSGLLPNTQYYYIMRAVQGTCKSSNSDEKTVTTNNTVIWTNNAWTNGAGPTSTLDAIVRGAYSTATSGNITAKDLTVENTGSVTIGDNTSVKVEGALTINNNVTKDNFVIQTGGNLLQTSTAANNANGIIQAQRSVTGINNDLNTAMDYVYWSSPVNGQRTNTNGSEIGFSPGTPSNRFYEYNESKDTFKATTDPYFVAGKGYAVRAETGNNPETGSNFTDGYGKTYKFNGVPNNGDISIGLNRTNSTGTVGLGFNLVGNPYPSNINFEELYAANSNVIYNTAYFWTNNVFTKTQAGSGYGQNNYAIYNGTGGNSATKAADGSGDTTVPNGLVSVGQAFIVQAKTQGGSTLNFKNSYSVGHDLRTATSAHFFQKQVTGTSNRFWLKLVSPSNLVNTQLIGYVSGATNDYEQDYDAETLTTSSDIFYSVLGSKKLLIQGRSENFSDSDVVPVGANFYQDGTYSIALDNVEGIFDGQQKIYLKDKLLGKVIDLNQGSYSFAASKGLDNTRFEIIYKDNAVLAADSSNKSEFQVYRDGDYYVIKSNRDLVNIELYDASGRLINSLDAKGKTAKVDLAGQSNGVYILKAQNSGYTQTKKIIK